MGKRDGSLSSSDFGSFFSDDSDSSRSEKRHRSEAKKGKKLKDKAEKKEKKDKEKKEKSDKKEKKDKSDKKEKKDKSDKKEKKDKSSSSTVPAPATASISTATPKPVSASIMGAPRPLPLPPPPPYAAAVVTSAQARGIIASSPVSYAADGSAIVLGPVAAAAAALPLMCGGVPLIGGAVPIICAATAAPTPTAGAAGAPLTVPVPVMMSLATTTTTAAAALTPPAPAGAPLAFVPPSSSSIGGTAVCMQGGAAAAGVPMFAPNAMNINSNSGALFAAPPASALAPLMASTAVAPSSSVPATCIITAPPPPPTTIVVEKEDISHLITPDQLGPITLLKDDDEDDKEGEADEKGNEKKMAEAEAERKKEKEDGDNANDGTCMAEEGGKNEASDANKCNEEPKSGSGLSIVAEASSSVATTCASYPTPAPAVVPNTTTFLKSEKENKQVISDKFSDDDDDAWSSDSSVDPEEEAAALAAFSLLASRVKKEAQRTEEEKIQVLLNDKNKIASAAAAAADEKEANGGSNNNNSFAGTAGNGQLVILADEEAEEAENLAVRLKISAADKETKSKIKKLHYVDHSKMNYEPIEKNFYIPPSDVAMLTDDEVKKLYKELDGAKVKGTNIPKPMKTWVGIGLRHEVVELLTKTNRFELPFAMQSLAMPVLMSGRDLLAIAKTGSGKTLAYTLPMIRHVANQHRVGYKRGPIALVLLPTHILAQQVFNVVDEFAKVSGLRVVCSFGGSDLFSNIQKCIAGCDIMIATPGRLIDLCTNGSKGVVNLPDCSFVVVDECDRMFDSGFHDLVVAFLKNCRPDRQLALISATMCKEMKVVARSLLRKDFIEISTGGKPSPSTNVTQYFDFFDQEEYSNDHRRNNNNGGGSDLRLNRLLEILSAEWTSHEELVETAVAFDPNNPSSSSSASATVTASTGETNDNNNNKRFTPPLFLIFVDRKTECDELAIKLWRMGYEGKVGVLNSDSGPDEQQATIARFAPFDRPILIATGSAERGLDIFGLDFVINYWMPDHYEAYVHRVGRTGRAGKRGRAFNFFIKDVDDPLAEQLIEGLEHAGHPIPEGLWERYNAHRERVLSGAYVGPSNYKKGFGSAKTYKFSSKTEKKQFRDDLKACGMTDLLSSDDSDVASNADSDDEVTNRFNDPEIFDATEAAAAEADKSNGNNGNNGGGGGGTLVSYKGGVVAFSSATSAAIEASKQFAALATAMHAEMTSADYYGAGGGGGLSSSSSRGGGGGPSAHVYQSKYVINDLPQAERFAIMRPKFLEELQAETRTTIVKKGEFIDKRTSRGKKVSSDLQPLYFDIKGDTRESLTRVFRAFEHAQKEAKRRTTSKLGVPGVGGSVNKNVQL